MLFFLTMPSFPSSRRQAPLVLAVRSRVPGGLPGPRPAPAPARRLPADCGCSAVRGAGELSTQSGGRAGNAATAM